MSTSIQCPKCEHNFYVEEVIAQKIEKGFKAELEAKENDLKKRYQADLNRLAQREVKLNASEKLKEEELQKLLKSKATEIRKRLKDEIQEQFLDQINSLQKANKHKDENIKLLRKQELALMEREIELQEQRESLDLELKEKMLFEKKKLQGLMEERLEQRLTLQMSEKQLLIKQLTERIEDMKRKTDQGSMQVQGEAQEIAIEELLEERFPLDLINPIGKGQRGADCLQIVHNRSGQECGAIVYESKRTKAFSKSWITKLKEDALSAKANIPVLVTQVLPEGIKSIGQIDGVWVCDFLSVGNLAMILRYSIIKEHQAFGTQENKGDKMQMLYDFLTGIEFKMQVEAILEGFDLMQTEISKQRRSMEASWKKQEKSLEKVMQSTIGMHSSVRGIAGAAVAAIPMLELDED
jgi:hypothetical protein